MKESDHLKNYKQMKTSKTFRRTFWGGVILLFLLVSCNFVSCKRVFFANFDMDAVNSPPVVSPAGNPADDAINFYNGNIKVINSTILGSKSLEFKRNNSGTTPYVEFITGSRPHNTDVYAISFKAYSVYLTNIPALTMLFKSQNNKDALKLILRNGNFELVSGIGNEIIGTYSMNKIHNTMIILNTKEDNIGIVITQEGEETITVSEKPFINNDFEELDRIRLEYPPAILEALPGNYVIDDITISKKE